MNSGQRSRVDPPRRERQRSLQNFTSSHTRSHFLRHVNGRPQAAQIFSGKCCFLTPRMR